MAHPYPAVRWSSLLLVVCLCAWSRLGYGRRFVAIGDYGLAGPAEAQVAALVKSWNPEIISALGDNNYDLGDSAAIDQNIGQCYHTCIYKYRRRYGPSASTNRFFPSLGNHDYYTRNGEAYRDYFTLPGNGCYYDFIRAWAGAASTAKTPKTYPRASVSSVATTGQCWPRRPPTA